MGAADVTGQGLSHVISIMSIPARRILDHHPIEASAPCRIDAGGTWDIKAMALPLERVRPVTINLALNLRTRVLLSSFQEGWVKVTSEGFPAPEAYPHEKTPYHPPLGLFFAAVSFFGFHGLHVRISSGSPVKVALGGSSTALVALLKALSKLSVLSGGRRLSGREILHLGYHLEDAVSGGNCGIQDQAAAVYGGVNQWFWRYGNRGSPLTRERLLDIEGQKELSERILVAFCGKRHVSARINRSWVKDFLSGITRPGWVKANEIVHRLAGAIRERNWEKASLLLREEMAVRKEITPGALIPITEQLISEAEAMGCGARFAGAGAGGSVWALGRIDRIADLRKRWEETLSPIRGAKVLDCAIDPRGAQ